MDQERRNFSAFRKRDILKLQVLQNKVSRLLSGLPPGTPTSDLLRATGELSVQQLTAYLGLVTAQKAMFYGKPKYLADRLQISDSEYLTRNSHRIKLQSNLTIARGSYFYRTAALYNLLPPQIRCSRMEPPKFKFRIKNWVQENIRVKPN